MMAELTEQPDPEVRVVSPDGKTSGSTRVPSELLADDVPISILKRVVVDHQVNTRRGTQSVQGRGDVRGGGAKPWRQKGTGRARQGTRSAPHWRGGGKALAPKPRTFQQDLNRRERRLAFKSALTLKLAAGRLLAVESLELPDEKTKSRRLWLERLGVQEGVVLLVDDQPGEGVLRSAANLPGVIVRRSTSMSAYDLLVADHVVITPAALESLRRGGGGGSA